MLTSLLICMQGKINQLVDSLTKGPDDQIVDLHTWTIWPPYQFAYLDWLTALSICIPWTNWPTCQFAYDGLVDHLVNLHTMDYLTTLSICIPWTNWPPSYWGAVSSAFMWPPLGQLITQSAQYQCFGARHELEAYCFWCFWWLWCKIVRKKTPSGLKSVM